MNTLPANHQRNLVLLVSWWAMCVVARAEEPRQPPLSGSRPNILFLYADDLGYGDLGCYGSPVAPTPQLDRLAAEGIRFTQFTVSHCVCSPTRCTAITGHFPSRWRIYGHLATLPSNKQRGMPNYLDPQAPSIPAALRRAGYHTGMVGKWHLGGGSGHVYSGQPINDPTAPPVTSYGFDYARIDFGNGPTWRNAEPVAETHDLYPYDDPGWQRWSSRAIVDDAMVFLDDHVRNHADQPFLLNVWFKDPHVPYAPTEEMLAPFQHLPERARSHYAMVHFMDQQIGRLLTKLDQLGLRNRTLVLFSSDNGAGKDRGGSCGPLRGWKWELYEGGIRVPLIARWPDQIPAGRVDRESIVNLVDFGPTFCRLTGAAMPAGYQPDGEDFGPALQGESWRRTRPLFWHHVSAAHRPDWAVRDGDWKLLQNQDGTGTELYNLREDVGEKQNLASQHPEVTRRLQTALQTWRATLP